MVRSPQPRVLAAVLMLGLALQGCPDRRVKRSPPALRIHLEAEPGHLVNMIQPDAWAHRITNHNLFESLIRIAPRTYKASGELASTWTVSKDHLTYTFYLRHGVRWHDGASFSGEDVKFTFDRLMDERVRATSARSTLAPFIESYALTKPDRFQIICKKASPWFLSSISDLSILPRHLMGKGDLNKHPLLRRPVGTGPYRFVTWVTGRKIELARFERYWGAKPRIARIVYRVVGSPDLALKLARRGELDFVSRIRPVQWERQIKKNAFFRHEFIRTRHFPPGTSYILLNHQRELFRSVKVRQALARLLDLDTIRRKILHGHVERVGALYWLNDPDYERAVKPVPFDPAGAQKLLSEAGWGDSDKNGVLDRDGKPFKFTFLVVTSSKSSRRWLTLYQQQLRKAGIVMDLNPIDWSTYLERIRKHDFDAGTLGMVQVGPFTDLYYQFHSSQIDDGQNYGAYRNKAADVLLEQIRETMDPAARRKKSLALQRLLASEMAAIPLFAYVDRGIVHRRIHGVYSSALWYQVRDWWIE